MTTPAKLIKARKTRQIARERKIQKSLASDFARGLEYAMRSKFPNPDSHDFSFHYPVKL